MLSVKDIINNKKKRDERKSEVFQILLKECCNKIRLGDELKNMYCIYEVPEFVIGQPLYNLNEAIGYIVNELSQRGFTVQYIFPKIIIVTWFNVNHELMNKRKTRTKQTKQPRTITKAKLLTHH